MSEPPWAAHRGWTEGTARACLVAAFPEFALMEVRYLDEGFDYEVYELDGRWLFKFPKRDDYARQLLVERRLLTSLLPRCPVQIPQYEWLAELKSGDVIAGYSRLEGRPALECAPSSAPANGSAALLAAFITHVHAFDRRDAADFGVPAYGPEICDEWRLELQRELDEIAPSLDRHLARLATSAVARLDVGEPPFLLVPTVNHGDLAPEHILLDPESLRITGVIDWSDAFVGDPAYDFGGILAWQGRAFAEKVLAYSTREYDGDLMNRASAYALNLVIGDMRYRKATGRAAYWEAGLSWLRRLLDS